MTTLQMGSSGPDVVQLQNALNALGYGLTVDGQFGINTKAAVLHFQSTYGLTLDGIVGPETFNAIRTAVSGGTPTPSPTTAVSPSAVRRTASGPAMYPFSTPTRPAPAGAISPATPSTTGILATISGYQNYILYGAIGFVGILVVIKMMKKK